VKSKLEELRKSETDALKQRERELRESLFRLNFKKVLGDTDTVAQIRKDKKELARVKTLLRGRELGIEKF
jgi:large subunit ribosomal protein L29